MIERMLVSRSIEDKIDKSQFDDSEPEIKTETDLALDSPFYVVLKSEENKYVGSLRSYTVDQSANIPIVDLEMICRIRDIPGLVKDIDNFGEFDIMRGDDDVVDSFKLTFMSTLKYKISQDDPLDSAIYSVYIRFGQHT